MELNVVRVISHVVYWILWILTTLAIALTTCYLYWKTTRNKRLIDKIPGFKNWPIVGDIFHIEYDPAGEYKQGESGLHHHLLVELLLCQLYCLKCTLGEQYHLA